MSASGGVAAGLLLALAIAGVTATQPPLARVVHSVKERDDVSALPPAEEVRAATLGWDAAAVDLLWAKLLVEYGTHWSEHMDFKDVPRYVDAILAIEPTYAPVYRYIDTMLAYRPLQGTEGDVRLARSYLEQGTRLRPDDADLWLEYGQFLAFVGPSFLHDEGEREAWRKEGGEAIGHAVELGAEADRALSAATLLTQSGEKAQAIRYLERAYAFTEHPSMTSVHDAIGRKLATLQASAARDAADDAARAIDDHWRRMMPYVARDRYLLVGPAVDPARCAGLGASARPECARSWDGVVVPGDSSQGVSRSLTP